MTESSQVLTKKPPSISGTICLEWWGDLTGAIDISRRNSGQAAELRRAHDVLSVVSCSSYHALKNRFSWLDHDNPDHRRTLNRLAVVAHVLPFVRKHDGNLRVGQQMGRPPAGASLPPVSELRFRRLVQVSRDDDLMQAMRRLVALLGNKVNVIDLAELIMWWGTPSRMKKLAFDYYSPAEKEKAQKSEA